MDLDVQVDAREWGLPDSLAFARLSGDHNPLHVDPVRARRSLFGECVAHGMDVALWALEAVPAVHGGCPAWIDIRFDRPVRAGRVLRLEVIGSDGAQVVHVACHGEAVVRISLSAEKTSRGDARMENPPANPGMCAVLDLKATRDRSGEERLWLDRAAAASRYPKLIRGWGEAPVAALLGLTRIVGMRCPGERAIFLQAKVNFRSSSAAASLPWRVRSLHPVTGRVVLEVGPGLVSGQLVTVFQPLPVAQPAYDSVRARVTPTAFQHWNALVVGGSRGLGELCAKIIAAAGGQVTVTGRQMEDVCRVAEEIGWGGGRASARALDVTTPPDPELAHAGFTHVMYFATPPIALQEPADRYEQEYERYAAVYVTAFQTLFHTLSSHLRGVLYPSSVAVDETFPGGEAYAAAKASGEVLCRELAEAYPDIRFDVPRLPRLASDQTASVLPVDRPDPVPILWAALTRLEEHV